MKAARRGGALGALDRLLVVELRELLDLAKRLARAFQDLSISAGNSELRSLLEREAVDSRRQVRRLESALNVLGASLLPKRTRGIREILGEADEQLKGGFADVALRDAALIAGARRVAHYAIPAYGTAVAHARRLGRTRIARVLEYALAHHQAADRALAALAERAIHRDAMQAGQVEEGRGALVGIRQPLHVTGRRPTRRTT